MAQTEAPAQGESSRQTATLHAYGKARHSPTLPSAVAGSPVVSGSGFDLYHNEKEGICVARLELPDYAYAIAAVRTGQFKGEGEKIWEGSFNLAGPSGDGQAAP